MEEETASYWTDTRGGVRFISLFISKLDAESFLTRIPDPKGWVDNTLFSGYLQSPQEIHQKYEAQKVGCLALISFCKTSIPKQPRKQAFHFLASQHAPVGPTRGSAASRSTEQLYPLLREVFFERRAVVGSVTDEPARRFVREARVEGLLDETYFVTFTRSDGGRYR